MRDAPTLDCPMHGKQRGEFVFSLNWWKCPGGWQPGGGGCRTHLPDEEWKR